MECELVKSARPSQVTTAMLHKQTRQIEKKKSALEGLVSPEGKKSLPRPGRLADGQTRRMICRVPWFYTVTPLSGTIASWGFGVIFHHHKQERNPVGEKLRHKCNNQTRIATKLGLSLCTVTNVHRHHRLELFCPFEEIIFRFFFSRHFISFFSSVKTKHAAYPVYAIRVTCGERENWRSKDASSANRSRPTRTRLKAHRHDNSVHRFHLSFCIHSFFFSFQPSSIIIIYHCIWHSKVTEAWCNYNDVHSCGWGKKKKIIGLFFFCLFGFHCLCVW